MQVHSDFKFAVRPTEEVADKFSKWQPRTSSFNFCRVYKRWISEKSNMSTIRKCQLLIFCSLIFESFLTNSLCVIVSIFVQGFLNLLHFLGNKIFCDDKTFFW